MAHFAQLDENNIVQQIIVIADEDCGGGQFPESELIGQEFIKSLGLEGNWKQTSYNSNFRRNYAGIGSIYSEEKDIFIFPKPFPSWALDENFEWQAPVKMPEKGFWIWDENMLQWIEIKMI